MSEMSYYSPVLRVVEVFRGLLEQRAQVLDDIGREAARVHLLLREPPPLSGEFSPSSHPITGRLTQAFEAGSELTVGLIEAIRPLAFDLPWRYSYSERPYAPALAENVAFAEIIGPEAPFRRDSVCLGLTLIGPETLYPAHRHPAVELYLVAAGTATWTLDGVSRDYPPGAFILHPSQAIHAMRTHAGPLLAIYSWTGPDVRTTSVYTRSARSEGAGRPNTSH